jgi:hypothetical protein
MRFEVLTAVTMNIIVIWDVTPCTLVNLVFPLPISIPSLFQCLTYSSALKMEATGSSKTLVMIYQTIQHHIPDDNNLHRKDYFHHLKESQTRRKTIFVSLHWKSLLPYLQLISFRISSRQKIFKEQLLSTLHWLKVTKYISKFHNND